MKYVSVVEEVQNDTKNDWIFLSKYERMIKATMQNFPVQAKWVCTRVRERFC